MNVFLGPHRKELHKEDFLFLISLKNDYNLNLAKDVERKPGYCGGEQGGHSAIISVVYGAPEHDNKYPFAHLPIIAVYE